MSKYNEYFKSVSLGEDYDVATSLSLAVACDLAYKSKKTINETARKWKFPKVEFIQVKKKHDIDTQCFVMANKKNIIVVFRGSDSKSDWFANFQAVRDPGPLKGTKAHEGFQDALFPAVISLTNVIDKFRTNKQKICLTGHSLGGAQCLLYAGMLIENGYDVDGIYTFASPRPADRNFSNQLKKYMKKNKSPHFRVVNTGYVVPHVPPEPFFSHTGERIILKDDERLVEKSSWLEQQYEAVKAFADKVADRFDIANNHRLSADKESYIPRLIKHYERESGK